MERTGFKEVQLDLHNYRLREERDHEDSEECYNTNVKLIDKESLSNSDVMVSDLDQATPIDACQVESSVMSIDHKSLIDNTDDINATSDTSFVYSIAKVSFAENIDNISDCSLNEINAGDTTKGNLKHQRLNENTDENIASMPKRPSRARSTSIVVINTLRYKVSIVVVVFFTIGCCLIPIILYNISETGGNNVTDHGYSHEINISSAKMKFMKACNFSTSESDYMNQILYTYESLRTINLPSSQQYCSERVETLFCEALMEYSNESYVEDIMCQQVRQEYCTAEWRMLEVHNQTDGLIDCEDYEETAPLTCNDQFDLANFGSICLPLCGEFSQYSETYTTPHVILYALSQFIGIIGGIIIITISFRKRNKMFRFPQVLIVINAGIILIIYSAVFISTVTVSKWNILCSSKFLFDSLDNPTAYCTVQGAVVSSGIVLYSYFWFIYICHLALRILFPMKSAKLYNSDYSRTIYIAEVLCVVSIATVPSIISAVFSKYRISTFPPTQCENDGALYFYVTIVPVMIVVCFGVIMMLLTLYKIHTQYGIFKRKHHHFSGKQVCTCQFTVPEIKIFFVLLYWIVNVVVIWTSSSLRAGGDNTFHHLLRSYADCMAGGNRKHHDCRELRLDLEAEINPVLEVMNFILIASLNFATLPFVIQFQTVKKLIAQAARKICSKTNM